MKKLLSLLAGVALVSSVGIAQAAEPITLTSLQMDRITAGTTTPTPPVSVVTQVAIGGPNICVLSVGCQQSQQQQNVNGSGNVVVQNSVQQQAVLVKIFKRKHRS
jgi:hypothetical protein